MANLSNINNKFLVTTGGNVLIGQTSAVGSSILQVASSQTNSSIKTGGLEMQSYAVNNSWYAENLYYDGVWRLRSDGYATQMYMEVGTISFKRVASGSAGANVSPLTTMVLHSSGNVGIGETSPGSKLQIKGNGAVSGLTFKTTDSSSNETFYINDGGTVGVRYYPFKIGVPSGTANVANSRFQIATTAGDFVVLNDGKTGIGTQVPSAKLEVVTAVGADAIRLNYGQSADIFLGFNSTNPRVLLQDNSNVVTHNFQSNGDNYIVGSNVGIGTVTPFNSAKLQVKTDTDRNVAIQTGTTHTTGIKINAFNDAANTNIPLELNGSLLSLKTGETEKMRIDSNGNVGIAWSSPSDFTSVNADNLVVGPGTGSNGITVFSATNAYGQLAFADGTGTNDQYKGLIQYAHPDDSMRLFTANIERLRITSNGSVYNGLASNTHFGLNALSSTTTADESTAFGNFALRAQQTGRNTAVGFHTLQDLSTGNYNTAVGGEAAENITTGDSNVAVGSFALRLGTTVSASTALGYQALYNATDSSNNTAVGAQASFTLTTGTQNTSLGWNALYTASTSTKNVAVGSQSMRYHTGTDNVAVGAYSMGSGNYGNGAYNVSLGAYAGYSLNTGASNTLIGNQAGYNVLNGANNIAIGQSAMYSQESVSANIAIGRNALYANVSGGNNTAIGDQALTSCTGSNNTAVGLYAGLNTTGNSNTFMGVQTFQLTTTGGSNVGMGLQAGYNNTVGIQNTYIGYAAGYGQTGNTGNANTAIGNYSQKDRAGGSGNTSVGHYALGSDVNAGFNASDNTAVGTFAGKFVTSGALNTFVGYNAGERITSGSNNTLLGRGAGTSTSPAGQLTSESNRVCLGNNSVSHLYCKISTITTSDRRDKGKFEDIELGLDFVNKLKPTAFQFKIEGRRDTEETDGIKRYGFLAQDILELEGENPVIINNDDKENLKYQESHLIPILVKAIQELKAEIELLKSK